MVVNPKNCKYYRLEVVQKGCCGRNKTVSMGACDAPGASGKMCNTNKSYCIFEEKDHIIQENK